MEQPRNWRTKGFRIIRGEGGNFKCQYYATKEARDAAGPKFAEKDGTNVIGEFWDASHPQDSLNQGWACDTVYFTPITLKLEIDNRYELYEDETTYVTVTVPPPPEDEDGRTDWEWDHIMEVTGVGHEDGGSWYFVEVLESSDPEKIPVGTEYEFGT